MPENYFLVNGYGKGYITPKDALHVFRGAAPALSASAVLEVYCEADARGQAKLGYREFERLLRGTSGPAFATGGSSASV